VTFEGTTFYRADWQGVRRREPRVVRSDADRVVCSLWALGRSLVDCLVLDRGGEVLERPPVPAAGGTAPLTPVWRAALADLIARESAPALAADIRAVMSARGLEWGPVARDLLRVDGEKIRISGRLRDAAVAWLREAPPGAERTPPAVQFALEVARLLAPAIRLAAQTRLASQSEETQRRALLEPEDPPPLSDSVARLLALLGSGATRA